MTLEEARERISILEEEKRQLCALLSPKSVSLVADTTPIASKILRAIAAKRGDWATTVRVVTAVYGFNDGDSRNRLSANLCLMRSGKRRCPFKIERDRRFGWRMSREDCEKILAPVGPI